MGEVFDLDVLAVSLFHQLNETVEVFALALRALAGLMPNDRLAADPDHDHADQRMHEHFPRRLMAVVLGLQR